MMTTPIPRDENELSAAAAGLLRESATELLRHAVSFFKVRFAVARIGDETIADSEAAPLDVEARLASEAARQGKPLVAFENLHAWDSKLVRFYAAVRLVDSLGRFRGALAIGDDQPHDMSDAWSQTLLTMGRQLTLSLQMADLAKDRRRECEQFRSLVEDSAVGSYCIRNDRFSYVNPKFAQILGYTKDEILAFHSFADIIPKRDRETVQEMIRRRQSGEVRELRYVTTVQCRDGTLLDAEIHGSVTDLDGERLVIGTALDVTAKRSANRQLREREEYFRVLTENVADVICIVNAEGILTYMSSSIEAVLGYKIEERLGRDAFEIALPEDRDRLLSSLRDLGNGERLDPTEFRFRHKNGSWRFLEIHGTSLLDHPQIRGFVISASDVTDRRRLERELEQLNRLSSLGRLSAQVAHEFNNVMMGMQPAVDVIRRSAADDPQMSRLTDLIAASISRGKRITSDILRFGRPAQLSPRSVDVQELLRQTADEVRPQLPVGTTLQLESPTSALHIHADPSQLSQVLVNLALNAKDAMQESGGTLTIGARHGAHHTAKSIGDIPNSDEFIHFNVTDTGEGISPENLPYIFEPLFTTKKTGTGLGLSVVYQVIAGHGGHIFVETERGQGTTFHIFIPAALAPPTGPDEHRRETASTGGLKVRVLIVEDEVIIATGLRWALEVEDMSVHTVARAADVMPAVEAFGPDVVLLDLSLPDADGRTVYGPLAARKLPVIFSTGSEGQRELIEQGHRNVAVLLKPYTSDDLVRTIHKVVQQRAGHGTSDLEPAGQSPQTF